MSAEGIRVRFTTQHVADLFEIATLKERSWPVLSRLADSSVDDNVAGNFLREDGHSELRE